MAISKKKQDYHSSIATNVSAENALNKDYSVKFLVDNTPKEAFDAITNVRGWFTQTIEGDTDKLGSVFYYHYQDNHRCTFKITEFVSGKKIVWHVLQNYFKFTKDTTEWTATDVVFEIDKKGDKTEVRFTHVGLVPAYEPTPPAVSMTESHTRCASRGKTRTFWQGRHSPFLFSLAQYSTAEKRFGMESGLRSARP